MTFFELKQENFDISRDRHAKLISSKLTGIPFVKMSTSLANRICEMHFSGQTSCKRLETELSDNFRISGLSQLAVKYIAEVKKDSRTFLSGRLNRNSRSKRPGLLSAGSIESSLFVAPMTTISPRLSKPSINASNVDTMELKHKKDPTS